jgi:hypothetical protein
MLPLRDQELWYYMKTRQLDLIPEEVETVIAMSRDYIRGYHLGLDEAAIPPYEE